MKRYTNGDCPFYHDCINGEDVGGEGTCNSCVHNFEEDENNIELQEQIELCPIPKPTFTQNSLREFCPTEIIINAKSDKSSEDLPSPETTVSASPTRSI